MVIINFPFLLKASKNHRRHQDCLEWWILRTARDSIYFCLAYCIFSRRLSETIFVENYFNWVFPRVKSAVMGGLGGSEQQYSLRWNDFHSSILSSFRHLRDQEDFVDVTLACDGCSFTAHKVVLSACSPYFRTLLKVKILLFILIY